MLKRFAVYAAASLSVAALLVPALYFFVLPWVMASVTRAQLEQVEQRFELDLEFSSAGLSRRHGLVLHDLRVQNPGGDVTITADSARIRADLLRLLLGRREIRRLELHGLSAQASSDHGDLTVRAERVAADGVEFGRADSPHPSGRLALARVRLNAPRADVRLHHETPGHWVAELLQPGPERTADDRDEPRGRDSVELERNLAQLVQKLPLPGELLVEDGGLQLAYGSSTRAGRVTERLTHLTLADLSFVLTKPTGTAGGRLRTAGDIAVGGLPAGRWVVELEHNRRESLPSGLITIHRLDVAALNDLLGPFGAPGAHKGLFSADLTAARGRRAFDARFSGRLELEDGEFYLPQLAREPLELPSVSYTFEGFLDPGARVPEPQLLHGMPDYASLRFSNFKSRPAGSTAAAGSLVTERGLVRMGAVELEFAASLHGLHGVSAVPDRLDISLELPVTPAQELLAAVPQALSGELSRMRLGGEFGLRFDLELPSAQPSAMRWSARPELHGFEVRELPPELNVFKLNDAFTHRIIDEAAEFERTVRIPAPRPVSDHWLRTTGGLTEREIATKRIRGVILSPVAANQPSESLARLDTLSAFGTTDAIGLPVPAPPEAQTGARGTNESYRYLRLEQLSDEFVRSVVTAEDHYFFRHNGINWPALKHAVEFNLEAGAYRLGASTISMQLAKNLFLSHDRVAARKLQELFLVYLMEQVAQVPKERILEVYLNVIEFGPGIFGVAQAARHYFDTPPSRLGMLDSIWISAILPNPKHYHELFHRDDGSEAWSSRMDYQLELLRTRGRITDEQYERARAELDSYNPRSSASSSSVPPSRDATENTAEREDFRATALETEPTLRQFLPAPELPELHRQ